MKDSNIEWVGKIPRTWNVSKVKWLGSFINGYAFKPSDWGDKGIPIIRIQNLTNPDKKLNYFDGEVDAKHLITRGDYLISWSATLSVFRWEYRDAYLNQHIFKVILNEQNVEYNFFYWLAKVFMEEMSNKKHGSTMQHVTKITFENFKVPLPSIDTQLKISFFLDNEIFRINRILEKTKESIEKLKKYMQSLITEVVTKGLNSDVEMKDSGIDWIGCVPESWRVTKLNQLFSIKKHIANGTGYDVLSVTQSGLRVKDITKNEGQMAADYSKYQIVDKDEFVMNHMDLLTGWIDVAQHQGVTSPDYRVFYNKQKDFAINKYYLYIFQTAYMNKIFYGLGQGVSNVGRWRLQTDKFLNFYVPLPSLDEQKEISLYLDGKTIEIEKLIENKKNIIEELESYKNSLIYEYVTGKKEA